ncbi:hypothetical protein MAR_031901 [Mya arenaria]|uniref:Uncharacterized protein n=1 Tax=Mya arenaria TaxID=6604 RepID=A0ABY7F8G4_MYAAR|nr:hypothetical protein MAR_031901 [Mya arenaria]
MSLVVWARTHESLEQDCLKILPRSNDTYFCGSTLKEQFLGQAFQMPGITEMELPIMLLVLPQSEVSDLIATSGCKKTYFRIAKSIPGCEGEASLNATLNEAIWFVLEVDALQQINLILRKAEALIIVGSTL